MAYKLISEELTSVVLTGKVHIAYDLEDDKAITKHALINLKNDLANVLDDEVILAADSKESDIIVATIDTLLAKSQKKL